jgi:signal transduction histidine kinase/ActR/RegA family two-component response regulator
MSENILAAMGRALSFCATSGKGSLEALVERAAWELHSETTGGSSSLAFIVRRRNGSSFVGKPRELAALPAETLLGLLVEDGGAPVACRVKDHALDTIRFIDARFRTSIVVRVSIPKTLLREGDAALWFGLQGAATPKKVAVAQEVATAVSEWFAVYAPVLLGLQDLSARLVKQSDIVHEMTSVAHDARAPLGALQYLLADLSSAHPEMSEDVSRLQRELVYVDELLEGLSPQSTRLGTAKRGSVDICGIIQRVCERLVPEIDHRGGRFVLAFPRAASGMLVRSSEIDIERILSNILGNAVRYAGAHDIRVEVSRAQSDRVLVTISDSGPGFPRAVIEALGSLEAERASAIDQAHGWGVGLVSCKRRLSALGGALSLETATTGGAMVRLELPLAKSANEARSEQQAGGWSKGLAGKTSVSSEQLSNGVDSPELIIIDDDAEHAASLERVLTRANVKTRSFSAISDALRYIERASCTRVVCDVHMPGGGAEEFLNSITVVGREVPCAVMSGETSDEMQYRFAALGAREFFAKPAPVERLIAWARGPLAEQIHAQSNPRA